MQHGTARLTETGEVHLIDHETDSAVEIAPLRGGLVKRFRSHGRDVLYFDDESFDPPGRSIRGGIPLLFPSPGALEGGRFEIDGVRGALPQHGFLRNRPFRVLGFDGPKRSMSMRQEFTADSSFPWSGAFEVAVSLRAHGLSLECTVHNHSERRMPFALGFHPYLWWPDAEKGSLRLDHHAEHGVDNKRKEPVRIPKDIDFTAPELDLHLTDHPSNSMALFQHGKLKLTVRASDPFHVWVLWTLRGRDFVCVEPWTALGNALNRHERLQYLEPGAEQKLALHLDVAH